MNTESPKYIAATLPSEGLVGIDLLINQPPRGDRPGRIGVFGIGRTKFYALIDSGVLPPLIKIGRKSMMRVETARQVINTLAQPSESATAVQ